MTCDENTLSSFDEIVGQDHITSRLKILFQNLDSYVSKLDMNFLISGPRGVGKSLIAQTLYKNYVQSAAYSCLFVDIFAETMPFETTFNTVLIPFVYSELIRDVLLVHNSKPKKKIIFIDNADALSKYEQLMLLQFFSKSSLILVTHRVHDIIPAIHSKMIDMRLHSICKHVALEYVKTKALDACDDKLQNIPYDGNLRRYIMHIKTHKTYENNEDEIKEDMSDAYTKLAWNIDHGFLSASTIMAFYRAHKEKIDSQSRHTVDM